MNTWQKKSGKPEPYVRYACTTAVLLKDSMDTAGQGKISREKITSINYGKITGLMLDPIEKKPLRRFCPGSRILSVGSFGCNLACPFCQNYEISMTEELEAEYKEISPEELTGLAREYKKYGNIGFAFTYNEPLVGYEFVWDTARLVRAFGMKNVLVTNGSAELEILEELLPYMML